jgi:hypothetical protein
MNPLFEPVHTVDDYYDGPLSGVADFGGRLHFYRYTPENDEAYERGERWFELSPISSHARDLAVEAFLIWQRWQVASFAGTAPQVADGAPRTLPEDRARYEELKTVLDQLLVIDPVHRIVMRGEFSGRAPQGRSLSGFTVCWTPIEHQRG